ncbi:hypothetical protein EVAR_56822_1 [Eumeta japonica]|uniref:Uncharacterized protein n=1 Tax=Eumeta variegata TaxID=151549 RepID=A0A4C1Y090_EUMVA|nr:hypothetical protein EVAR_56822_1 [Eumeta japonica]
MATDPVHYLNTFIIRMATDPVHYLNTFIIRMATDPVHYLNTFIVRMATDPVHYLNTFIIRMATDPAHYVALCFTMDTICRRVNAHQNVSKLYKETDGALVSPSPLSGFTVNYVLDSDGAAASFF